MRCSERRSASSLSLVVRRKMMLPTGKRILFGALIAVSGAYAWAFAWAVWFTRASSLPGCVVGAAYAVLVTSWFVLPIGAFLGAIMPAAVRACSRRRAILRGALLGICAGLLAAILSTVFIEWRSLIQGWAQLRILCRQFIAYAATMLPVCILWVTVWACRWRDLAEPSDGANAALGAPRSSS